MVPMKVHRTVTYSFQFLSLCLSLKANMRFRGPYKNSVVEMWFMKRQQLWIYTNMQQARTCLCCIICTESHEGKIWGQCPHYKNEIQTKCIHVAYFARPLFVFSFMKNHSVLIINAATLISQTTGKLFKAERMRTKLLKMAWDSKQIYFLGWLLVE